MGLFDRRRAIDPSISPGGGYGGGIRRPDELSQMIVPGGMDMSVPQDPYAGQRPSGGGFFGKMGGLGNTLANVLAFGPLAPIAMMKQRRQDEEDAANNEYKRALAEKAMRDQTQDPSVIRALRAMGIDPTSPEGRRIGTDSLTRPFMVGSPETGWNPVGGSYGTPSNEPPADAIAELRADPSGAAEFDQIFGAGASRRYLGQQ